MYDLEHDVKLQYDMNAKNVLTANSGWDWSQVTAAVPALASGPRAAVRASAREASRGSVLKNVSRRANTTLDGIPPSQRASHDNQRHNVCQDGEPKQSRN